MRAIDIEGPPVVTGEAADHLERIAGELLADRLHRRAVTEGRTRVEGPTIVLGTPESSRAIAELLEEGSIPAPEGSEAFVLADLGHRIVIAAETARGVLYGAGRLVRDARFEGDIVRVDSRVVSDAPAMRVRNIYFADHMGNWYTHAPAEEVREHLEDMALWGYNELMTCLAVRQGEGFFDAVRRNHELEAYARSLGMRAGIVVQSNTSFDPPPEGTKATPGPIPGAYDVCPSKPGAREFLVEDKKTYLNLMQPFDYAVLWPYDGGGCFSDDCAPWGRTFLSLSREIAEHALDDREARVSAWFFERDMPGEDDALFALLDERPDWFRTIVAGAAETKRWREQGRSIPDPYRVLLFPDIAMFDGIPWGGRGANPAPRKFAAELATAREMLDGAIVYSEGRYDDINKVLWSWLLWNPDADVADAIEAYCRVYFGSPLARDVADLIFDMEDGAEGLPEPERWRRGVFHPEWDERAAAIEARLSPAAAGGWRWRLLRTKTVIERAYAAVRLGSDREHALAELRQTYAELQSQLNRHDERSLATWFYAPVEEAFALEEETK